MPDPRMTVTVLGEPMANSPALRSTPSSRADSACPRPSGPEGLSTRWGLTPKAAARPARASRTGAHHAALPEKLRTSGKGRALPHGGRTKAGGPGVRYRSGGHSPHAEQQRAGEGHEGGGGAAGEAAEGQAAA